MESYVREGRAGKACVADCLLACSLSSLWAGSGRTAGDRRSRLPAGRPTWLQHAPAHSPGGELIGLGAQKRASVG